MIDSVKYYNIAGVTYRVQCNCFPTSWNDGILRRYVMTEDTTNDNSILVNITIDVSDNLSAPEGNLIFNDDNKLVFVTDDGRQIRYDGVKDIDEYDSAYMRIDRMADKTYLQVKPASFGSKSLLKAMEIEHTIAQNSGVLFHAAYICFDNEAVLFTAPSGVGKSTQARLWCEHRNARLINGDRCAVIAGDNGVFVHGVPYCGSSGTNYNRTLPLKAIVCLSQSPISHIEEINGISAFVRVWSECCINTWNADDVSEGTRTVTNIVEKTPVFSFSCTPDVTAVKILEDVLKELSK